MRLHRVGFLDRHLDLGFTLELGFELRHDVLAAAATLGAQGELRREAFESAVFDHRQRSAVAANQPWDVLGVGHRAGKHDRVALGIIANQVEGVGHFTVFELIDATTSHHLVRKLRLTPTDVHGSHDVIEQVRGDAA